jgi:phage-related protein (TIGR01555 family)
MAARKPEGSAYRLDDLVNALTGLGLAGKDKRLSALFEAETITQAQLEEWYRGSDLAASIVELVPEEMFRRGFDLAMGAPEDTARSDIAKDTLALLEERGFLDALQEGLNWARAYGGAGVLLGAEDGRDLSEPLEEEGGVESFEWMTVLSPKELRPLTYYEDIRQARYGRAQTYEVRPQSFAGRPQPTLEVHESRLIRFDGVRVSRHQRRSSEASGWGDSVLVRCYPVVRDYTAGWQSAALLLQNFALAWMKMKGLAEMVAEEESTRALVTRATGVQLSRSAANMVLLDAEEEIGVLSTPLSGYPEMMQQFAVRLAAAARMPVTVLMGQSPAGLNATGESDVRNWYASIARLQEKVLRPALNRVLQLLFRSEDGPTGGSEPDLWEVRFRPLWQLTELQQAEVMQKTSFADDVYLKNGVVTPEELAVSRFGDGKFSMDTTIDVAARKSVLAELDKEEVAGRLAPEPEPSAGQEPPPEGEGGGSA